MLQKHWEDVVQASDWISTGENKKGAGDTLVCAKIGTNKQSPFALQSSAISKRIGSGR